ncbi:MAG: 3-hydroxyacyl-CoA dehydrogenase NAD-binding domain-containing protein [Oceanospirillaceae bacterium]
MNKIENITILGAGTIGMSWAALFLATRRKVCVYDPATDIKATMLRFIEETAPTLQALGWELAGNIDLLSFNDDPADAVNGADFIQESIPERIGLKHSLYQAIENNLGADTIVATSTSGLQLSALQKGFKDPSKLILAHPFNPPHLIPLVELMINEHSNKQHLVTAESFYQSIGKQTIRLNKEVAGHIANRLQAALWRESIHLLKEGVASLEDIDKAVAYGPGLRWAALGPSSLFHLGGGEKGIAGFCEHIGPPMQTWWDDLGDASFDEGTVQLLVDGIADITKSTSTEQLKIKRDKLVLAFIQDINNLPED